MALPAVKHLDPVVGVDLHSVMVTPSPTPVFLPHPHIGFMLDLREYVNAALGVIGAIAFTIVEEKAVEYLEDHPDDVKQLGDTVNAASNEAKKLGSNPTVAHVLKGATMAADIANAAGAGVGMGSIAGRPIFVNGMLRATAGTHAFHVPSLHFPLGASFAPPDPDPSNDAEAYMGSKTVLANNDPMAFLALPAMSCWAVGLEPPTHNGAHTKREHLSLPTSFMLPIPTGRPVLVGGPPIVNMAALAKGLFKAFRGSEWAKSLADKLNLKPGFLRCTVLKAEPVDATTGEVVVQQSDFTVSGRLPLEWDRCYASHERYVSAVGVGWLTPADIRLELIRHEHGVGAAAYFTDYATAFDTLPDEAGWQARVYDWQHGYALYRRGAHLVLRTTAGIEYAFVLSPDRQVQWCAMASEPDERAGLVAPVDRMADLNGNAWIFEREPDGSLIRLVECTRDGPTKRVIECGRGHPPHAARLTSLTLIDADGRVHPLARYEHDHEGNLVAAIDAMTQPHRFEYASDHRMVRHASARGVSFYYSYLKHDDGVWRADRAWGDEVVLDYRFVYDRERMETRVTDSLGHTTVLQLNARGMPVAETDPLGGVTTYRYDAQSRASARIDAAGRATTWEYDAYGNLQAQTLPDGSALRNEYDDDLRLVCVTAPGGRVWRYEWDACGNLLAQTTPAQATSRYAYDACGQLIAHVGPRGGVTRFEYDRDGNPSTRCDALGRYTQYVHDSRGNLIQAVNALGQTSRYEYDRNGNLLRAIEPGGLEIHCIYDADGNLTRYRDPLGHVTQLEYSALGHVSKRLTADGNAVEYLYDTEAQLVCVVDERGRRYELQRDAMGRIVEEVDYYGQSRQYGYDLQGRLLRSIDPLGQAIVYRTDALGRIVQKQVPDSRQPDGFRIETLTYDGGGNLVIAENPDSRVELTYDLAGRVVEEKQGDDFTIANVYDESGNRIERTTRLLAGTAVLSHTVRYAYNELDEVTTIQIGDEAPITLERDELGQIRVEHLGTALRRELSYGIDGRPARQTLLNGTGVLFASEYTYDANGNMLEKRDARLGVERFEYDPVGRLTHHVDPTSGLQRYLFDPAGDLLKTPPHASHERHAQTREGSYAGCHYTFDLSGNLVRRRDATQDLLLHWDSDGLLIETEARRIAIDGESNTRTRYTYDALHRRIGKVSHTQFGGRPASRQHSPSKRRSRVSRFFWDGDALAREFVVDGTGPDVRDLTGSIDTQDVNDQEWIYYPETFCPLALLKHRHDASFDGGDRQHLFYQTDPNGSPVRIVDARGQVRWEASYTAWGGCRAIDTYAGFRQPLRLQGQYFDDESGLHYNRYRYYDSLAGTYISPDPLGFRAGENIYGIAPNVFDWIDPLGLKRKSSRNWKALKWMPTKTGHQRQHIIPHSLRNHPIFLASGANIDAPSNLMYMPKHWSRATDPHQLIGLHRGWTKKHKEYNEMVEIYLDDLEELAHQSGWDRQTIRQEIYGLQSELRRGSRDGRFTCAKFK
ncbi:RHS repeat-associated core domain-containing protein [Burkholderia sp. Bp8990]|uniref:RHS repeat-associated core domain-containing protein n=1 Tax=Burkholderia sp. Bp8990 TaxID=2184552 RepID=UPI000F5A07D2|nr:RHS repeat-associated core domain-containing protein [Burkholderia sp. Bp8990]RQS46117.1 type IV secretion protein Rhs [Burkholderia sp. Bp8990]